MLTGLQRTSAVLYFAFAKMTAAEAADMDGVGRAMTATPELKLRRAEPRLVRPTSGYAIRAKAKLQGTG